MKRRIMSIILITMMVLSLTACGKSKEEKETSKEATEETVTEEETPESVEETTKEEQEEYKQPVTYKEYVMEAMNIDLDNIEPVSESGNTYDFNTELLGYYTNGYIGFNFYQVQGDKIATDLFIYDYYMGSVFTNDVMDTNKFSFVYSQGMTDAYADADGVIATDNNTETSITIENDSFLIDSTVKVKDLFNSITQGNHIYLYYLEESFQGEKTPYDILVLGKYEKQDSSYIDELKCTNYYDPLIGGEYSGSYYENNQPEGDRMSKEQSPKYVKYIPNSGYYVHTKDPEKDPGKDNPFMVVKVSTNDQDLDWCWASIRLDIRAYAWSDELDRWCVEPFPINNLHHCVFSNFNYEINEWEYIESVNIISNEVNEDGTKDIVKMTMSVNEDGSINLVGGQKDWNLRHITGLESDTLTYEYEDIPLSMEEPTEFRAIDASIIEGLSLPENSDIYYG